MTALVVDQYHRNVTDQPTGNSVRLDLRHLLGDWLASDLLELLVPKVGLRFQPSVLRRYDWFHNWQQWYDERALTHSIARNTQQQKDRAFGHFIAANYDAIEGVGVILDDPTAGWEWVSTHAWHKIVEWVVGSSILYSSTEKALADITRGDEPPLVLEKWRSAVFWVVKEGDVLRENASWVREQSILFCRDNDHDTKRYCHPDDGICAYDADGLLDRLVYVSQDKAASWSEYLVGCDEACPRMSINRALEYVRAGVGATEARALEFGPPGNLPTFETLAVMAGLVG